MPFHADYCQHSRMKTPQGEIESFSKTPNSRRDEDDSRTKPTVFAERALINQLKARSGEVDRLVQATVSEIIYDVRLKRRTKAVARIHKKI